MWLWAIYRLSNDKVVTCQSLANDLGVNIKTAWLLLQKVRYLLKQNVVLNGVVSIDEMYFGGSWHSKHRQYKENKMREDGFLQADEKYTTKKKSLLQESARRRKANIIGLCDENKFCQLIHSVRITQNVVEHLYKQHDISTLVSDEANLYTFANNRVVVNHEKEQYIEWNNGVKYSTNNVENKNSWIQRIIGGGHIQVKQKYLQLYLNEIAFRLNCTGASIEERFKLLCTVISRKADSVTANTIKTFDYMAYNGLPEPIGYNCKLYNSNYRKGLKDGTLQRNPKEHSDWYYNCKCIPITRGKNKGGNTTPESRYNALNNKKTPLNEVELNMISWIKERDKEELEKQKHTL